MLGTGNSQIFPGNGIRECRPLGWTVIQDIAYLIVPFWLFFELCDKVVCKWAVQKWAAQKWAVQMLLALFEGLIHVVHDWRRRKDLSLELDPFSS